MSTTFVITSTQHDATLKYTYNKAGLLAKAVADCTTGNIEGLIQHLEKQHEYAIIANKRCKQEKYYVSSVKNPSDKIFIQLCESLIITCTPVRSELNLQIK